MAGKRKKRRILALAAAVLTAAVSIGSMVLVVKQVFEDHRGEIRRLSTLRARTLKQLNRAKSSAAVWKGVLEHNVNAADADFQEYRSRIKGAKEKLEKAEDAAQVHKQTIENLKEQLKGRITEEESERLKGLLENEV